MSSDPSAEKPTAAASDFATQMHLFWENNRRQIYFLCLAVLLAILGREGWAAYSAWREQGIQTDYAQAAAAPEKLARFATDHAGHPLAGVALLRVADDKYTAGDFPAAQATYTRAAAALTHADLQARARLGAVMSQLAAGDRPGAEAALRKLADDTALARQARAEAAYHLAALAQEAGRIDEVKKYLDVITQQDPAGVWSQRAYLLRARLPAEPAPAPAAGITFTPDKK